MEETTIEACIRKELPSDDQAIALELVRYLHECGLALIKDCGYWVDKHYYLVKFHQACVCFISVNDPDEKENCWTVWSDNMDALGDVPLEPALREIAWRHVDFCGACGSCGGGRRKTIFGKTFENVCVCTFRFDNPEAEGLPFLKKLVGFRKRALLHS